MLEAVIRYEPGDLVRYYTTDFECDLWAGWAGSFPHLLRPSRLPADPGGDGVIILPEVPDSCRGWQPVGRDDFQTLSLSALDRTGPGRPRSMVGLEFVLCPPKSFSILALAYKHHPLVRCHLCAVADFLGVLGMLTAVRRRGEEKKMWPEGFLFTHPVSHVGDPHLHTHIVLLGQGGYALHTWPILHVFRGLLAWVYEYSLTSRLSRTYPLEVLNAENGHWHIPGLPVCLEGTLSKASAQIRAAAELEGDGSRRNRYRLARKIRREAEKMHPTLKVPVCDAMRSWMPVVEDFPLSPPFVPGPEKIYEPPDSAWLIDQLCRKSFAREEKVFEAIFRRNFLAAKTVREVWKDLEGFLGKEVHSGHLFRTGRYVGAPTIMTIENMLHERFAPPSSKVETNTSLDPVMGVALSLDTAKPEHRVVCIAETVNAFKVRKKLAGLVGEKAMVADLGDSPPLGGGSPLVFLVVDAQADLRDLRPWLLWRKSESALRIVVCGIPPRGSVWYSVMGLRLFTGVEPQLKSHSTRVKILRADAPDSPLGLSMEVIRRFFESGTVLVFAAERKRRQELSLELDSIFHRVSAGTKIQVASPLSKGTPVSALTGKVVLGLWGSGLKPAHQLWKISEDRNRTFFVPFRRKGRRWPLVVDAFPAISDRFAVVEEKRCAPGAQFVCLTECGGEGTRRLKVGDLVQVGELRGKIKGPMDRRGRRLPPLIVAEPCYTLAIGPKVWPKTTPDYILVPVEPGSEAAIPQLLKEISKRPPAKEIVLLSANPSRLREILSLEFQDDVRDEMDVFRWKGPYAAWLAAQPAELTLQESLQVGVGETEKKPPGLLSDEIRQDPAGNALPKDDPERGAMEMHYVPEKPSPLEAAVEVETPQQNTVRQSEDTPVPVVVVVKKKPKKKVVPMVKGGMEM